MLFAELGEEDRQDHRCQRRIAADRNRPGQLTVCHLEIPLELIGIIDQACRPCRDLIACRREYQPLCLLPNAHLCTHLVLERGDRIGDR